MNLLKKHQTKAEKELSHAAHHGEVRHVFLSPEFVQYHRGPVWYLVAGIFSLAVVAGGILTHSITLVIAYLLFVAVYFLIHQEESGLIEIAITQHGIRYGEEFFAYGTIKNFWILHDPPYTAELKLHLGRRLNPIMTIHIFGQDPESLRSLLTPRVDELRDKNEALIDIFIKTLRL